MLKQFYEINISHIISNWLKKKSWFLFQHQIDVLKISNCGYDVVLNSPTGSGKTLAGFLPSINNMITSKTSHLHTIYISPLKSLAYDIEKNLKEPIKEMKLKISVGTRTGDTSYLNKKKQLISPPNILVTTIESFTLLMAEKDMNFFKNLKFVIVDEAHSLINTKRGELLSLNLTRLKIKIKKIQTILLSATLKEPEDAGNYFCKKKFKIIKPKITKKISLKILNSKKRIPWSGHMADYAIDEIYKVILKKKSIIFVNTRAQSEFLFQNLWKINISNLKIAIHHGSLEKKLRLKVEEKMAIGELDCVVATSSLDMGLDWGKINIVIQVGTPKGISRLLQRIGRCNHTIDGKIKGYLVPTNRFEFIECHAAIKAVNELDIENIPTRLGSLDVLAQHIIGVSCSEDINLKSLYDEVIKAWPYRKLTQNDFFKIINFLVNGGYSLKNYEQFSKLKKKKNGNYRLASKLFIKKYKLNVGTIVESQMLEVKLKNKKLGQIEEWFIQKLRPGDTFLFGGKILKFNSISMGIVLVNISKGTRPKIPSYAGGRMPLSTKLSSRVLNLLNNENDWKILPRNIEKWLKLQKKESQIPPFDGLLIEHFEKKKKNIIENFYVLYTFQGKNANQTLGFILSKKIEFLNINPLGFVTSDYGLAIWTDKKIGDIASILNYKDIKKNLFEWLENSSIMSRSFRKVAIISGLLDRGYPNKKNFKQLNINSDLIFEVLKKHEKNHILLTATYDESKRDLIEIERIEKYIKNIEEKIKFRTLKRPSPLSIPLLFEINNEYLDKNKTDEFYLKAFEEDLLNDLGLNEVDSI